MNIPCTREGIRVAGVWHNDNTAGVHVTCDNPRHQTANGRWWGPDWELVEADDIGDGNGGTLTLAAIEEAVSSHLARFGAC